MMAGRSRVFSMKRQSSSRRPEVTNAHSVSSNREEKAAGGAQGNKKEPQRRAGNKIWCEPRTRLALLQELGDIGRH